MSQKLRNRRMEGNRTQNEIIKEHNKSTKIKKGLKMIVRRSIRGKKIVSTVEKRRIEKIK